MASLNPQIAGTQAIAEFSQRTELIIVAIDFLVFPDMIVPARFDKSGWGILWHGFAPQVTNQFEGLNQGLQGG